MNLAKYRGRMAFCAWLTTAILAWGQEPAAPSPGPAPAYFPNENGPLDKPIKFYGSLDYLLFEFRDGPAPPLIQHVPTNQLTTPLDPTAARTMFGDGIRQHAFSGYYAAGGFWFHNNWAIDGSYVQFQTKTKEFSITSAGDPAIGRYFYDVTNNSTPSTFLIYSQPTGPINGSITATAPTKFSMFDLNARTHGYTVFSDRVDWLAGIRYADLKEGIVINDFTNSAAAGISYTGEDRFETANKFYGAQVGFNAWTGLPYGFTLDVTGKLALGAVRQQVDISGFTIEQIGGVVTRVLPGDVLTQTTNIGSYQRTQCAAMPEFMVKVGYQCSQHINISLGYDVVAITNVMRPGSAIDPRVNPNVSPLLTPSSANTTQVPAFDFNGNGTDFWAQGLTFGVSVYY